MYTIIESQLFTNLAKDIWSEDERGEFCAWLVEHPEAGNVIQGSGGCRKVRWGRAGMGKRGGVRVIYLFKRADGRILFLTIYAKTVLGNIPAHLLKAIVKELENV